MSNIERNRVGQTRPGLRARVAEFFFAEEVPFGLALVRIIICIACLMVTLPRWIHSRELFSSDGAPAPLAVNYGYFDLLPIPSGSLAVVLMTVLSFCCVTACVGWWTRTSLWISAVLYTYLNLLDCLSTMTKYSVITSHLLFLLAFSQCGAVWSVDAWLRRRQLGLPPPRTLEDHPKFAAWPRRLIQILIGVVYFGASVTKMHTPAYFSGDQLLHWMMTNVNNSNPVGEWLTLYPAALVVFAYLAVIWEILFLFVSWRGWGRACMLAMGVAFHVMTTFTLGLYLFPITCIATYFAFVNSEDVVAGAARWRSWKRRHGERVNKLKSVVRRGGSAPQSSQSLRNAGELTPNATRVVSGTALAASHSPENVEPASPVASAIPLTAIGSALGSWPVWKSIGDRWNSATSLAAFGLLLTVVAVGAVEVEYRLDPFGERRTEGPYSLKEISTEEVQRMFAGDLRLREYDKYLSFDIGTTMFAGMVTDRRNTFRHGESIIAQCTLSPPHEDMWVECNLHDASNVVIDRVGQVVVRSQLRGNFLYRACEALEPGDYFLVLKTGNREITRRKIQIQSSDDKRCRVLAN
ncbi:MAG: HTTM domain-containing protein [Planctomycetaceae bacterium]